MFLLDKFNYSQHPDCRMKRMKGIFVLILALGCMNLFSGGHLASFIETALSPGSFSCETGDSVPDIGIDPTPDSIYLAIMDHDSDRKFLKLINELQKFLDDMSNDDLNTSTFFINDHEDIIVPVGLNAHTDVVLASYFYGFLVSRLDSSLPSDSAGGGNSLSITAFSFNDMAQCNRIVFLCSNKMEGFI